MITNCPSCNQKNRIPDRPRTDGIYKCGVISCRTFLLRHRVEFHDRLIRDIIDNLKHIKEDLESIRFSIFRQRDIYDLKNEYDRIKSRMQNWLDYAEFRDPIERQQIYGTYKQELCDIRKELEDVSNLIDKKEEIKRVLRRFRSLASTIGVLKDALSIAVSVLNIFGVNVENIQFILEDIKTLLIKGGSDNSK